MFGLRLRRSLVVWWMTAVALAAVTGVVVAGVVGGAEARAARYGSVRRVLVARHEIAAGRVLRAGDVTWTAIPAAFVPDGPLARSPVGRTVIVPLDRGEVVLASKVAPLGLTGAAALLRRGERALAVPASPGTPPLAVGDIVDVLATLPESGETSVVAARARVLAADDRAITVAVRPHDAPAVAAALATATVALALAGR